MKNNIGLVHQHDPSTALSESRGKGLEAVHTEPATGVTIISDETPQNDYPPNTPVVTASDAEAGPVDFDV